MFRTPASPASIQQETIVSTMTSDGVETREAQFVDQAGLRKRIFNGWCVVVGMNMALRHPFAGFLKTNCRLASIAVAGLLG